MPRHCSVDGRQPALLDVVRFEHSGPTGEPAQPENVRITGTDWEPVVTIPATDAYEILEPYLVEGPDLLGNRGRAVPDAIAQQGIPSSLALIEPEGLELCVEQRDVRRSARAQFWLGDAHYDLPISELALKPALLRAGLGTHTFAGLGLGAPGRVLLTISLGEPFEPGKPRWKLVAGVTLTP
jgi:hypothetical protein